MVTPAVLVGRSIRMPTALVIQASESQTLEEDMETLEVDMGTVVHLEVVTVVVRLMALAVVMDMAEVQLLPLIAQEMALVTTVAGEEVVMVAGEEEEMVAGEVEMEEEEEAVMEEAEEEVDDVDICV